MPRSEYKYKFTPIQKVWMGLLIMSIGCAVCLFTSLPPVPFYQKIVGEPMATENEDRERNSGEAIR
jgi:hypothetical protein